VPSTRREVASSAAANNATAKSYRDVVRTVGGNPGARAVTAPARNFLPELSIVTRENSTDVELVTVVRKKRAAP
jgi:hypothetical protein